MIISVLAAVPAAVAISIKTLSRSHSKKVDKYCIVIHVRSQGDSDWGISLVEMEYIAVDVSSIIYLFIVMFLLY